MVIEIIDDENEVSLRELERRVVEAALACDSVYLRRLSTWPEDDELHFACRALLAARATIPVQEDTK